MRAAWILETKAVRSCCFACSFSCIIASCAPKSQARKKCSKSKSREITSKAFKSHNHLPLWGFAKALGEHRFRGHIALEVGNWGLTIPACASWSLGMKRLVWSCFQTFDFHRKIWQHLSIFDHFSPGTVLPEHFSSHQSPRQLSAPVRRCDGEQLFCWTPHKDYLSHLNQSRVIATLPRQSAPPQKKNIKLVDEEMVPQERDATWSSPLIKISSKCSRPVTVMYRCQWLGSLHDIQHFFWMLNNDAWKVASDSYLRTQNTSIPIISMSRKRNASVMFIRSHILSLLWWMINWLYNIFGFMAPIRIVRVTR